MNEEAVKKLTRKGCIIEKESAEMLTEEDVEIIMNLDTLPMYLKPEMLEMLREQHG